MTSTQDASVSISIVCYHNERTELEQVIGSTLKALKNCSPGLEGHHTLSLVDNSEDNSLNLEQFAHLQEALDNCRCELRIVQGQGNVGYGAGHNLALLKATATYSLLLNPDIVLDPKFFTHGLAYLQDNPDVAIVSPSATYEDGSKQYLCKRYPSVLVFLLRGFMPGFVQKLFSAKLARFEMQDLDETVATKEIPIVSGCCMLARTQALQEVQGFDDSYFLYFEDFDLSIRLGENHSLSYLPTIKVVHHGGNSANKGLKHIRLFVGSGIRFFNRHGWRWFG